MQRFFRENLKKWNHFLLYSYPREVATVQQNKIAVFAAHTLDARLFVLYNKIQTFVRNWRCVSWAQNGFPGRPNGFTAEYLAMSSFPGTARSSKAA
jgi:hypothetical protein